MTRKRNLKGDGAKAKAINDRRTDEQEGRMVGPYVSFLPSSRVESRFNLFFFLNDKIIFSKKTEEIGELTFILLFPIGY